MVSAQRSTAIPELDGGQALQTLSSESVGVRPQGIKVTSPPQGASASIAAKGQRHQPTHGRQSSSQPRQDETKGLTNQSP
jgi:hypothetical protein